MNRRGRPTSVPARALELQYLAPGTLKVLPGHARQVSNKHVRKVADSIAALGFLHPVLVDDNGSIICGAVRTRASQQLGMATIPVLRASGMSEVEKRAYRLAENRLGELGEWDDDALAAEFQHLIEEGFEVELTGFDTAEIDRALAGLSGDAEERVELPIDGEPAVTRTGDLWAIGPHRIICGDSSDEVSCRRLFDGEQAQMVFTDPPYNVEIAGNVAGIRTKGYREFAMASGEMSSTEYEGFLRRHLARIAAFSQPGAIVYVCMDWRHVAELTAAAVAGGYEHKQLCVWMKTNAGMGSFYRSQHELVFVFKVPGAEHINNFGLGQKGRIRTNVWTYAGANGFRKGRSADLADHPTVKPTPMVMDAIRDCSKRNGIIFDGFAGSGTTLVAAERTGRRGFGVEIDPGYVDVILRRLEAETGLEAIHENGETFAEIAAQRLVKEAA